MLDRPVELDGEPATVRGSVAFGQFGDPAAVSNIVVELAEGDADADADADTRPNAQGDFVFENRPAGLYFVRVGFPGFTTDTRRAPVRVGEEIDVDECAPQCARAR